MTEIAKRKYVDNLAKCGLKMKAAEGTGRTYDSFLLLRQKDPDFAAECDAAIEIFRESLEDEVLRRGRDGWEEPVYQQGTMVGTRKRFDSGLLLTLLKRHRPEYRDRSTLDHNVQGGVLVVGEPQKTVEEWLEKHDAKGDSRPE